MRLRDLNAQFVGRWHDDRATGGSSGYRQLGDQLDGAQGVMFQCPKCAIGKERGEEVEDGVTRRFVRGAHYVICWFRNPRNAVPVPPEADPKPGRWWVEASCTGLDDLTFGHGEPSMAKSVLLMGGCDWHGFVVNGEATES